MRRQKFILTIIFTMVLGFNIMVMPVYAAPQIMPDGTVFDPEYYATNNPDVVTALGTTTEALYQHYIDFGKNEGRKATADTKNKEEIIAAWKEKYPTGTQFHYDFSEPTTYHDSSKDNNPYDYYKGIGPDGLYRYHDSYPIAAWYKYAGDKLVAKTYPARGNNDTSDIVGFGNDDSVWIHRLATEVYGNYTSESGMLECMDIDRLQQYDTISSYLGFFFVTSVNYETRTFVAVVANFSNPATIKWDQTVSFDTIANEDWYNISRYIEKSDSMIKK